MENVSKNSGSIIWSFEGVGAAHILLSGALFMASIWHWVYWDLDIFRDWRTDSPALDLPKVFSIHLLLSSILWLGFIDQFNRYWGIWSIWLIWYNPNNTSSLGFRIFSFRALDGLRFSDPSTVKKYARRAQLGEIFEFDRTNADGVFRSGPRGWFISYLFNRCLGIWSICLKWYNTSSLGCRRFWSI